MNENGSMLIDSLLGLAVLTICGFLLLPVYIGMMHYEEKQQTELHASKVLLSAAHFVKQRGQTAGEQSIDGRQYNWKYDGHELCVTYTFDEQEEKQCLSKTSTASH